MESDRMRTHLWHVTERVKEGDFISRNGKLYLAIEDSCQQQHLMEGLLTVRTIEVGTSEALPSYPFIVQIPDGA